MDFTFGKYKGVATKGVYKRLQRVDVLPFCEPVLSVVSGAISACDEVKHRVLVYSCRHFDSDGSRLV